MHWPRLAMASGMCIVVGELAERHSRATALVTVTNIGASETSATPCILGAGHSNKRSNSVVTAY